MKLNRAILPLNKDEIFEEDIDFSNQVFDENHVKRILSCSVRVVAHEYGDVLDCKISGKNANTDEEFAALLGHPIPDGKWAGVIEPNDAIALDALWGEINALKEPKKSTARRKEDGDS